MHKQLLPPAYWEEFEQLCHALWKELLSDPNTAMHGRRGQAQIGIDIYGRDFRNGTGDLVGVQCKGKDNYSKKKVTESELKREMTSASNFAPKIKSFVLATTAARDANIQKVVRRMNTESIRKGEFSVSIWDWPDISQELQQFPALMRRFYPESFVQPNLTRSADAIKLSIRLGPDHEQKVAALFEIAEIKDELQEALRYEIRDFATEIASNAFRHGGARKLEIEIKKKSIVITDDGKMFNPLAPVTSAALKHSMQGLKYVQFFLNQHVDRLAASYAFHATENLNTVMLSFNLPVTRIKIDPCVISFSQFEFLGRREAEAEGLRVPFPSECDTFSIYLGRRDFNMSSLYSYLSGIVSRLPAKKKLNVMLPDQSYLAIVENWFDPTIVTFIVA